MRFVLPLVMCLGVMHPFVALAQEAAAAPDGLALVPAIIEAAQGGHWSIFASLIIMVLVWLVTKAPLLKDLIKGEAKLWVAASAGILSAVAMEAFTTQDWLRAILSGLGSGLAAGGLWELISRRVSGKAVDANGDGVLDEHK